MSNSQLSLAGQRSSAPILTDLSRFFPGWVEEDDRRRNQLLDVNSLLAYSPDSHAASARELEYIAEEVRNGSTEEGERHIRMLCTLIVSVEACSLDNIWFGGSLPASDDLRVST